MKNMLIRIGIVSGVGLGLLALGSGKAFASGSIEINLPPTVTGVGPYTWSYLPNLSQNSRVDPTGAVPNAPTTTATLVGGATTSSASFADYFVIYDFEGFTGTHTEPAGWSFFTRLSGPTAADQTPVDNAGILNLVWYRTGATVPGPAPLGTFTADSIYNQRKDVNYQGSDTRISDGATQANISSTDAPVSDFIIPEPGTMALVGTGLIGMVAGGSLRRRRSA